MIHDLKIIIKTYHFIYSSTFLMFEAWAVLAKLIFSQDFVLILTLMLFLVTSNDAFG